MDRRIIVFAIAILMTLLSIQSPVSASPTYYTQFTILEQTRQLFDPVVNATVIATPMKPEFYPWLVEMLGMPETFEIPVVSGVTDNEGSVTLPMYKSIKYNLTIKRENKPNRYFFIYPYEDSYIINLVR
jgi:hypothetical protein